MYPPSPSPSISITNHNYVQPHSPLTLWIFLEIIDQNTSLKHMGVSKNRGIPKSSILIGFSIIFTIHFGVPLFLEAFGNIHIKPRKNLWCANGFPRPPHIQCQCHGSWCLFHWRWCWNTSMWHGSHGTSNFSCRKKRYKKCVEESFQSPHQKKTLQIMMNSIEFNDYKTSNSNH